MINKLGIITISLILYSCRTATECRKFSDYEKTITKSFFEEINLVNGLDTINFELIDVYEKDIDTAINSAFTAEECTNGYYSHYQYDLNPDDDIFSVNNVYTAFFLVDDGDRKTFRFKLGEKDKIIYYENLKEVSLEIVNYDTNVYFKTFIIDEGKLIKCIDFNNKTWDVKKV